MWDSERKKMWNDQIEVIMCMKNCFIYDIQNNVHWADSYKHFILMWGIGIKDRDKTILFDEDIVLANSSVEIIDNNKYTNALKIIVENAVLLERLQMGSNLINIVDRKVNVKTFDVNDILQKAADFVEGKTSE